MNVKSIPSYKILTSGRLWWVPSLIFHELLLLAATFFPLMSHPAVQHREGYFWFQWDSLRFIDIGQLGYTHLPGIFKYKCVAFFPFVPILVRIFSPWGLLFIEQVTFVLVLLLLKSFSERMGLSPTRAIQSAWLFALSPAAIFYSTIYAEPWTIFGTLTSLYFATRRRWLFAGMMGLIASMSQGTGILGGIFPLVLFIRSIIRKNVKLVWGALIWGIGCGLGLLIYMVYLDISYHHPFLFSTVQSTLWHSHWKWPWFQFVKGLQMGGLSQHRLLRFAYEGIAVIYILGAIFMTMIRRTPKFGSEAVGAKLYVIVGLLVSFSFYPGGTPFHSALRIASVYFPLYTGLAKYLPKWLFWIVITCFVGIAYAGTSLFTYGYFFQ